MDAEEVQPPPDRRSGRSPLVLLPAVIGRLILARSRRYAE